MRQLVIFQGNSIHALREEGDFRRALCSVGVMISIHALREEGDCAEESRKTGVYQFLSTPSARRATRARQKYG